MVHSTAQANWAMKEVNGMKANETRNEQNEIKKESTSNRRYNSNKSHWFLKQNR